MKPMKNPFLFACLLFTLNVFAQQTVIITSDKPGWHRMGELPVNFEVDTSQIQLIGGDAFAAIRLKAKKGTVEVYEITLYYSYGLPQCIPLEITLKDGEQTASIQLKGKLRKVELLGKTLPIGGEETAQVQLSGFQPPSSRGSNLNSFIE
jgi:hypothetical protein